MNETEKKIIESLTKNATTFLNCSIQAINQGLNIYNNKIIAIVNMQMALELAMKVKIVEEHGVISIIQNLDTSASETEIKERYENNTLKIKEFDCLKNFLKSQRMFDFEREQYRYIDRFQTYRNKLVHFNYNFSSEEENKIEFDLLYVLVYLLGTIMSTNLEGKKPTFMQDYIDMRQYQELMKNSNYSNALKSFISDTYDKELCCPICFSKLLTPSKKCLGCLIDLSDETHAFGYIDCKFCGEELSVIYDRLNINNNKGFIRGLCINCQSDTVVYQCTHCNNVYDYEGTEDKCTPDFCINEL